VIITFLESARIIPIMTKTVAEFDILKELSILYKEEKTALKVREKGTRFKKMSKPFLPRFPSKLQI
jgi:hypothetical protein